jgi:hypothetical protein
MHNSFFTLLGLIYNFTISCQDIDRESDQIKFDINDLERWRDRVYAAIHSGSIVDVRNIKFHI